MLKNILVFINPYGGNRKAKTIWEEKCAQLFMERNCNTEVFVTTRSNSVYDYLRQNYVNEVIYQRFDGIICVGGDGTVSECINGMMSAIMEHHKIKHFDCRCFNVESGEYKDDSNFINSLQIRRLPLGIIPGGSTNTVAYSLYGTCEPRAAALHILDGNIDSIDLSSIHDGKNGTFIKFFVSVLSRGYLGDVAVDSERYRWMGPKRYAFSGAKKLLKNKCFSTKVNIWLSNSMEYNHKNENHNGQIIHCHPNSTICDCYQPRVQSSETQTELKQIFGSWFMVNLANLACRCARSPHGIAPNCHMGTGQLDIVLVHHTSFWNNIRMLLTMTRKQQTILNLNWVEIHRTKQVEIHETAEFEKVHWNCDGEILKDLTSLNIRGHKKLLNIFYAKSNDPICDISKRFLNCC